MQLYIFKCTCAVDIHPLAGAIQGYVYDKQFDTRLKKTLRATDVLSISVYAETHRDIYSTQCKSTSQSTRIVKMHLDLQFRKRITSL